MRRGFAGVLTALACAAFCGPALANAGAAFTSFQDPRENAFAFDVPSAWTVRGGMFRLGYSDYRPMVDVTSRDGAANIRFGDVVVPVAYALPTAQHPTDGEPDDLGAQAQLVFARYRSGSDYARLYALTRFKTLCARLTPQPSSWNPPPPAGLSTNGASEGRVTYRCEGGGRVRTAYVYAMTAPSSPGLWRVTSLISFITPPELVGLVHLTIAAAARTFRTSPAWIARQKASDEEGLRYQIARQRNRRSELGAQVQQFEARMRGMRDQVSAFERGQSAQAAQVEGFSAALRGVTSAIDPLSGQTRELWTGPDNGYWENGSGTIVNARSAPSGDFHRLQPH